MFQGSWVALVTPFRDGQIDWDACRQLVEAQIEGGTQGLVVFGTTGEAPTLDAAEKDRLLRFVVEQTAGRVPVMAGTGSYNTRQAIQQSSAAMDGGADSLLVVAPYYNKPGDRGLRAHFEAIAEKSTVPILLYNIPGRTGCHMSTELVRELCRHPQIGGIKDATGSPQEAMALVEAGVTVMAGDDALILPWMAMGAAGVVSVAANVAPAEVAALVREAAAGDFEAARTRHYRLLPLYQALFIESNPVPVKALLGQLGRCTGEVRLPLVEATSDTHEVLRRIWQELDAAAGPNRSAGLAVGG